MQIQLKVTDCSRNLLYMQIIWHMKTRNYPAVLLICDKIGNIIFASGDRRVLQISHHNLLHRNFFELGLSLHSHLFLINRFKQGILPNDKDQVNFQIQIKRNKLHTNSSDNINHYFKKIQLHCSVIKLHLKLQQIRQRIIPIETYDEKKNLLIGEEQTKIQVLYLLQIKQSNEQQIQYIDKLDASYTEKKQQSRMPNCNW